MPSSWIGNFLDMDFKTTIFVKVKIKEFSFSESDIEKKVMKVWHLHWNA